MQEIYDITIVGGGIAGLTAAIYSRRKNLNTIIITPEIGGQTNLAINMENYPGFKKIKGNELIKNILEKVIELNTTFIFSEVIKIEKKKKIFLIYLNNGNIIKARAIILAFGKTPRKLGIGEEKFIGKGISTCVICDAPLYKDKIVAVVGGGNSAVDAALELSNISKKVYLIHRRENFRADEISIKKLNEKPNIEILFNSVIKEINHESKKEIVENILVENLKTGEKKKINVDGVFLEIGFDMKSDWLKDFVKLDKNGQVIVDKLCQTSRKGVFAAGDCTDMPFKQAIISAGQGAIAALQAYKYLTKGKEKLIDWS